MGWTGRSTTLPTSLFKMVRCEWLGGCDPTVDYTPAQVRPLPPCPFRSPSPPCPFLLALLSCSLSLAPLSVFPSFCARSMESNDRAVSAPLGGRADGPQLQAHLREHVMSDRLMRLNDKGKTVYAYVCKVSAR